MNSHERKRRVSTRRMVVGWIVMALVIQLTSVSQLVQAAIVTDFNEFAYHPGPGGWWVTCSVFAAYSFTVMAVTYLEAPWFRWLHFGLAVAATVWSAAHHLTHLLEGFTGPTYGPFGVLHVHHVAGVLLVVESFRWATSGRQSARVAGSGV